MVTQIVLIALTLVWAAPLEVPKPRLMHTENGVDKAILCPKGWKLNVPDEAIGAEIGDAVKMLSCVPEPPEPPSVGIGMVIKTDRI